MSPWCLSDGVNESLFEMRFLECISVTWLATRKNFMLLVTWYLTAVSKLSHSIHKVERMLLRRLTFLSNTLVISWWIYRSLDINDPHLPIKIWLTTSKSALQKEETQLVIGIFNFNYMTLFKTANCTQINFSLLESYGVRRSYIARTQGILAYRHYNTWKTRI